MNKRRWLLTVLVGGMAFVAGCQSSGTGRQVDSQTRAAVHTEGDPLLPRVLIKTTLGEMLFELDAESAPESVLNFAQYVYDGFYDGTVFHRVIKGSMIQGGDCTPDMKKKIRGLRPSLPDAWQNVLKNERGTIAIIRGRGPQGAGTAQFFINVSDNPKLDDPKLHGVYAVFGRIVEGMDTVEKINSVPVGTHPDYAEGRSAVVPIEPIVIKSIRLVSLFDPIQIQAAAVAAKAARQSRADAITASFEKEAGRKAVTTESGIRYVDFKVGDGPTVLVTDTIEFQYRGTLLNGTEFENTFVGEPPVRAVARLIPGLQEALLSMNEGGRRSVLIPPDLAYGEGGIPGRIPPDSMLIFDLLLLEIK